MRSAIEILSVCAVALVAWLPLESTALAQSGQVDFQTPTSTVNANDPGATIRLVRTGGTSGAVSVRVRLGLGTAVAGVDYVQLPGSRDASFDPGTGANANVIATAIQPDGKILIGGTFSQVNGEPRSQIARLNADGTLDTSFDVGTGADGSVRTIALQDDGKILIGGQFDNYNGVQRRRLARLHSDGELDTSFNANLTAVTVNFVAVQPNQRILFATTNVFRRLSDGSVDTSFSASAGTGEVYSLALQSNGRILVAGAFTTFGGLTRNRIARLLDDGSLDTTFAPDPGAYGGTAPTGFGCTVLPNGRIMLGGAFTHYDSDASQCIVRILETGERDTTFDSPGGFSGGFVRARHMTAQADGRVLFDGVFTEIAGQPRSWVARVHADGSLDPSFAPVLDALVNAHVVQPDGKVIVVGNFTEVDGVAINRVARLHGDWHVEWDDGDDTAKEIVLPLLPHGIGSGDRTVELEVYLHAGAATMGPNTIHTLTISDDAPSNGSSNGSNKGGCGAITWALSIWLVLLALLLLLLARHMFKLQPSPRAASGE